MSLQSFVANSLSLSRVFIGYYIFQHTAIDLQSLLFCLFMALITDFVDGKIARLDPNPSKIGKVIDPICDAIFMIFISLSACLYHQMPMWFFNIILLRYAIIGVLSTCIMYQHQIYLGSNLSGKISITLNFMTPCFFISHSHLLTWGFLNASLIMMGVSFIHYLKDLHSIANAGKK